MTVLVTGGAGFIGANFIHDWLARTDERVVNLDKLTDAGNLDNLAPFARDTRHLFVQGDVGDSRLVARLLAAYRPRAVLHFAAESHADRSIHGPDEFVHTNVLGTYRLLEESRQHWESLPAEDQAGFRFLLVSANEVYGSLGPDDPPCDEGQAQEPDSPYAATKAAADHLVRAWRQTFGLPVLVTRCSSNYGPYQSPEKFIPRMIINALAGKPLLVHGDGLRVRDWLHVRDHCAALRRILEAGVPAQIYNIGGANDDKPDIEIVHALCAILDECSPRRDGASYRGQIRHVADRPDHHRRYAIDAGKLERELGWQARETLADGLRDTVRWYLENTAWVDRVRSGAYRSQPAMEGVFAGYGR